MNENLSKKWLKLEEIWNLKIKISNLKVEGLAEQIKDDIMRWQPCTYAIVQWKSKDTKFNFEELLIMIKLQLLPLNYT